MSKYAHPDVIVYCEKAGHFRVLGRIHQALDVTVQALRGRARTVTQSYLAQHTREAVGERRLQRRGVHLVGLVDYDPFGYDIARGFREKLQALGVRVRAETVLPTLADFSEREIATHAVPLHLTRSQRGLGERWLAAGGGVDGEWVGIGIEALPVERLYELALAATRAALAA